MTEKTPLHVIGGSLGSGKTTLLRHLLDSRPGRIAMMVNEFGEVGIDGELLRGDDVEMMELAGGCVCCSLAGEFAAGIREIIDRVAPVAIVVETTGVAEADALVADIQDDLPEVRLESVTVLVDADAAHRFPELGHVERNQLASADLILLNKADLVDDEAMEDIRRRVGTINETARMVETTQARVDPGLLLASTGGRWTPSRPATRDTHDHGMTSFTWAPAGNLDRACFERAVADWPGAVYRAKGRIVIDETPMLFSSVAGRWILEPAAPGERALVFIGPGVDRHRERIIERLERCIGA